MTYIIKSHFTISKKAKNLSIFKTRCFPAAGRRWFQWFRGHCMNVSCCIFAPYFSLGLNQCKKDMIHFLVIL